MSVYDFAPDTVVQTVDQLQTLYGEASERALVKELDHVSEHYRALIEASGFVVLASVGPEGVDVSPRGDPPGFVKVVSPRCLMLPDRRGNNRADTLKNIVRDPRVSLLFMIPGVGTTLRVIGLARVVVDEQLCGRFMMQNKPARSVLVIDVQSVYFQCQKALVRSGLWDVERFVDPASLPSAGEMLQHLDAQFDGKAYDASYKDYMRETIY
ncbi:MAG: pyridoxamine 5'-phosphate oxidase family protein [Pseudomonadota bacterium]